MTSIPEEMQAPDALSHLNEKEWVWVDVREEVEWNFGHLAQSKHMPLSSLTPMDLDVFSKDQRLMVVCRSGSRSRQVVQFLRAQGFSHACNLSGGLKALSPLLNPPVRVLL